MTARPAVLKGRAAAERFVDLITHGLNGSLCWRLLHDSDKAANGINFNHQVERLFDTFEERQADGYGVFAVVNGGGQRDAHIDKVRAVFIDADDVSLPETWHLEPHFIVRRSETHWHAYWLTSGMTPEQFTEVQRRLAVHYGTDPSISNPSRVMRIPGFAHLKNPQQPQSITLTEMASGGLPGEMQYRYSCEEVTAGLPELPEGFSAPNRRTDPKRSQPLGELDLEHNIEAAKEFLHGAPSAIAHSNEGGDNRTYQTACEIRDRGVSEAECLKLMLESEWNQRCNPPWTHGQLAVKVRNAYSYGQNRAGEKQAWMQSADVIEFRKSDKFRQSIDRLAGGTAPAVAYDVDGDVPADIPDDVVLAERRSFTPRSEAEQDARPVPEWLIDGVIQRDTLNLFYGPENSFKSFLVLDLVLSAAAKRPWAAYGGDKMLGGYAPSRALTTVYIAGEGAGGIERMRRPAWREHYGVDSPLPFYTIDEMPFFKSAEDIESLITAVQEADLSPDLIVIDTAARAMLDLDENSVKDTGIFIAACDLLKRKFKCAVLVVHHSGKDDRKGSRGSSNLPASFDARFRVKGDTASLVATIKNEKQKDGEPWSRLHHFQGHQISLENGRTSLVFTRNTPSASTEPTDDDRRIAEVRAALMCQNGDTALVANKVLATMIVDRRLETDPVLKAKSKLEDIDRMVENERRKLLRQARNKANGEPGLLRQFVAGDPSGDILWTLPADTDE